MFWFSGQKTGGNIVPGPEFEPLPTALEGKVLTTGPLGKSQFFLRVKSSGNQNMRLLAVDDSHSC